MFFMELSILEMNWEQYAPGNAVLILKHVWQLVKTSYVDELQKCGSLLVEKTKGC